MKPHEFVICFCLFVIAVCQLANQFVGKYSEGAADARSGFPPSDLNEKYLKGYKDWYDCEKHFLETGYTIHGELKRPDLFKGVE